MDNNALLCSESNGNTGRYGSARCDSGAEVAMLRGWLVGASVRSRAGAAEQCGCRILFIITDDDPRPGPVAISPAIIAILFIVIAFITLLVTDFTVCRF